MIESMHRSHGSGTFVIDRRYHGVGRVRLASGTTNPDIYRRMLVAFAELHERGRLDLLQALQDRVLHPLELYDAYRSGELERLPTAEDLKPLPEAVEAWLPRLDVRPGTRDEYERQLEAIYDGHARARVADLPKLVTEHRDRCQGRGRRRTFNLARTAVQAFLRDLVGRDHRLYRAIAAIAPLRLSVRRGNPMSVERVRELARAMGNHGASLWSLCLTGMRRGEYWGTWELAGDRILIHGTKTAAADRFVPSVFPIVRSSVTHWGFGQALNQATGGHVRVHDTRKTFAHWCELAGIPKTRIRAYLGHGRRDVTDLYTEHDVRAFLVTDAEKLQQFIGGDPAQMLRAVK